MEPNNNNNNNLSESTANVAAPVSEKNEEERFIQRVQDFYFNRNGEGKNNRRAVCIGFSKYNNTGPAAQQFSQPLYRNISSCRNDALRIERLLKQQFNTLLIDDQESLKLDSSQKNIDNRDRINSAIDWLFNDSTEQDTLIFYFSGHGKQIEDNDMMQSNLVLPKRSIPSQAGYPEFFRVADIVERARNARYRAFVLILDCCYGGNVGDRPNGTFVNLPKGMCIFTAGLQGISVPAGRNPLIIGKLHSDWQVKDPEDTFARFIETDKRYDIIQKKKELYYDYSYFSSFLVEALTGGAANPLGIVTLSSIYQYVSEAMGTNHPEVIEENKVEHARPMMKSNLEGDVPICYVRTLVNPLTFKHLNEFRMLFPEHFSHDPNEPESAIFNQNDKDHQMSVSKLLKLGLIRPMGRTVTSSTKPKIANLYRITPRGLHFLEMYRQLMAFQCNQSAI